MPFLFFIVSFTASIIGSICGIGGGVIIKPTLDLLQLASISSVSFLSGCTVLSMTSYSVGKAIRSGTSQLDLRICTPLAVGAAIGGVTGNSLFSFVKSLFANPDTAGAVQAFVLALITIGTLIYTLLKDRIQTKKIDSLPGIVIIGIALGIMSSFLGIGGGPINLIVLYFFFSMTAKTAAQNSLYVILFSQITSLATTILTGKIPPFEPLVLIVMIAGGVMGGIAGRSLNKRLDDRAVEKLFIMLMIVIIGISLFNGYQYSNIGK